MGHYANKSEVEFLFEINPVDCHVFFPMFLRLAYFFSDEATYHPELNEYPSPKMTSVRNNFPLSYFSC